MHYKDNKVALISDIHFGVRNSSDYFINYYKYFFFDHFIPFLLKEKIYLVGILGDLNDNQKILNIKTINLILEFFNELKKHNVNVFIILGNHDVYYKNTNFLNSINPLILAYDNIYLIDAIQSVYIGDEVITTLPWLNEENREEYLSYIEQDTAKLLFAHLELKDFQIMKNIYNKTGLAKHLFKKYIKVFTGHYHIHDTIDNICYLGNPFITKWSEYDEQKGFIVFNTKTYGTKFIKTPNLLFNRINVNDDIEIKDYKEEEIKNKYIQLIYEKTTGKNENKIKDYFIKLNELAYEASFIEQINEENYKEDGVDTIDTTMKYTSNIEMLIHYINKQTKFSSSDIEKIILEMIDVSDVMYTK